MITYLIIYFVLVVATSIFLLIFCYESRDGEDAIMIMASVLWPITVLAFIVAFLVIVVIPELYKATVIKAGDNK